MKISLIIIPITWLHYEQITVMQMAMYLFQKDTPHTVKVTMIN
jgi:hypothetical protein